jgi:hypothetical protein
MATRDAAIALVQAHVDLAKAEASAIAGQVGRIAALAAIAIASLIMASLLATIGTALFLGEWLLGSIGWGVLEGILAFVTIAIAGVLGAVGVSGGRIGRSFVVALVVAIVIGVALALQLPNQAYAALGESARLNLEPGARPLVVGVLVGALLGVLIGVAVAVRAESGAARVGAIVTLAIVGALLGAFSAITFSQQVGAAVGVTLFWLVWLSLMAVDVISRGVDVEELKDRFYPTQSIDTGKETLEWLQKRMPPGIGS